MNVRSGRRAPAPGALLPPLALVGALLACAGCAREPGVARGLTSMPGLELRPGLSVRELSAVSFPGDSVCAAWAVEGRAGDPAPYGGASHAAYVGTFRAGDRWSRLRTLDVGVGGSARLLRAGAETYALLLPACRLVRLTPELAPVPVNDLALPGAHGVSAVDALFASPDTVFVAYSTFVRPDSASLRHELWLGAYRVGGPQLSLREVASWPVRPNVALSVRLWRVAGRCVIVATHAAAADTMAGRRRSEQAGARPVVSAFVDGGNAHWRELHLPYVGQWTGEPGTGEAGTGDAARAGAGTAPRLALFGRNGGVWLQSLDLRAGWREGPALRSPVHGTAASRFTAPAAALFPVAGGAMAVAWAAPEDHTGAPWNLPIYFALREPPKLSTNRLAFAVLGEGAADSTACDVSRLLRFHGGESVTGVAGTATSDGGVLLVATEEPVYLYARSVTRLRVLRYSSPR